MSLARVRDVDPTYLVRLTLKDARGNLLAENVYWESTTDDDVGTAKDDVQFKTTLVKWADFSALNSMPLGEVEVATHVSEVGGEKRVAIQLTNPGDHVAFFLRAEITSGADGLEVLPITYDDNYVTVFPHETRTIVATFNRATVGKGATGLRVEGYNVEKKVVPVQ